MAIGVDFHDFIFCFLLSDTQGRVGPQFQTLRYASYFQLYSRYLEMCSNTVFRVWSITN